MNFGQMRDAMALRAKLGKMERELKKARLTADAQGGKIRITVDGTGEVQSIEVDPELLSPDRKRDLEKGLAYAFNSAREAAGRFSQEKFQELIRDLPPEMRAMLGGGM
ncbi:MAG: YbaB/EbfC family nucleoid-associated protein [candidate division WOR-3 bacterium]